MSTEPTLADVLREIRDVRSILIDVLSAPHADSIGWDPWCKEWLPPGTLRAHLEAHRAGSA